MSEQSIVTRTKRGKFAKGNRGGPGNPFVKQQKEWQRRFYEAMTPEDFSEVMEQLKKAACNGEKWAVLEILTRCLGKPAEVIEQYVEAKVTQEQKVLTVMQMLGIPQPQPQQLPQSLPNANPLPALASEGDGSGGDADEPAVPLPGEVVHPGPLQGVGEEPPRRGDVDRRTLVGQASPDDED